jgi:hypothetical protein
MAVSKQRTFQQKGQVDTQWEMIGSPSSVPSSEVVAEYDTTDSMIVDAANQSFGGAGNVGQKNESGNPPFKQVSDPQTQEDHVAGPRYDSEVKRAYPDTQ